MHEESDKECALYENMFVQVFKFRPQHGSNSWTLIDSFKT